MKKIILGLLLLLTTTPVLAGNACATGFTRIGPNFCERNSAPGSAIVSVSTNSVPCTASPAITGVTDATAVLVHIDQTVASTNAAGTEDNAAMNLYGGADASCASYIFQALTSVYEFVATPASTIEESKGKQAIIPSTASGVFHYLVNTGTAASNTSIYIDGYFD